MKAFLDQANHNEQLLEHLESTFPTKYFDWKITVSFYIAIHYLKAYAKKRKKEIGSNHDEVFKNISNTNKAATCPISTTSYKNYSDLFHYSRTARYDGIINPSVFEEIKKIDYYECKKHLNDFRLYIVTKLK